MIKSDSATLASKNMFSNLARRFTVFLCVLLKPCLVSGAEHPLVKQLLKTDTGEILKEVQGLKLISTSVDESIHLLFAPNQPDIKNEDIVEIELVSLDDPREAVATTPSFKCLFKGIFVNGKPSPKFQPLIDKVVETIRKNDPGGIIVPASKTESKASLRSPTYFFVNKISAYTGLFLVVLFLITLPFGVTALFKDLFRTGNKAFVVSSLICALGVLIRLVLPHYPVMYYMGYHLAQVARDLEDIPKYGSGALGLYHLLFYVTGTDHVAMMYLNSIISGFSILSSFVILRALFCSTLTSLLGGLFLALTPVFIKDATTESLLEPTIAFVLLSLAFALKYQEKKKSAYLFLALLHSSLSAYSRPEFVVFAPMTLLLSLLHPAKKHGIEPGRKTLVVAFTIYSVLLILRVWHLKLAMDIEFSRGNTPALRDLEALKPLLNDIFLRNILFFPSLYPLALTLLAFISMFLSTNRVASITLVIFGFAMIAITVVDLPYVSIYRVQVPGAVFVTLASAEGLCALLSKYFVSRMKRTLFLLLLGVPMAYSFIYTTKALWARTNDMEEEDGLRLVRDALRGKRFVLVRRSYNDEPRERLHLYYPDYWFEMPQMDGVVLDIDKFMKLRFYEREVYFYLGTRCYMRDCNAQEISLHPACEKVLRSFTLETIFEHRFEPHRPDLPKSRRTKPYQELDFPWCLVQRPELKIGLYKVTGHL